MEQNQQKNIYTKIIVKAWTDPQYKERLLKNPEEVFRSEGIEIPKNLKINVVENEEHLYHVVMPKNPNEALTDEELEALAGGVEIQGSFWQLARQGQDLLRQKGYL